MSLPFLLKNISMVYHLLDQMVASVYSLQYLPWQLSIFQCIRQKSISLVQIQTLSFSTSESLCDTGNGNIPSPAATKPAGQANGRPPASQQWQSPQTSPGPPPNKPMPQDIPASPETIKMSSEFKVQPCTKAPLTCWHSLFACHVMVVHACYTVCKCLASSHSKVKSFLSHKIGASDGLLKLSPLIGLNSRSCCYLEHLLALQSCCNEPENHQLTKCVISRHGLLRRSVACQRVASMTPAFC